MPKLARIVWIVWIAAACGRQPPSPGAGSTSNPPAAAPGAAPVPRTAPAPAPPFTADPAEPCDPNECGPPMRMPNRRCPDGSIGGPTDRCLRQANGKCAWEVRPCP
jgi:hypothetical protein